MGDATVRSVEGQRSVINRILHTPQALAGLIGIFISMAAMLIRYSRNRRLKLTASGNRRSEGAARDVRSLGLNIPTIMILGLLLVSATVFGFYSVRSDTSSHCVSGRLDIDGSSAFHPMAVRIGDAYRESGCANADIKIFQHGSNRGIRGLISAAPKERPSRIAMSDGLTQTEDPHLVAHPVGVVVFSVVANRDTGIDELSTEQLRKIHQGKYTNWAQLGGRDVKISIVSRGEESGTRIAFEEKVLERSEGAISSIDCVKGIPDRKISVIRCEREDTKKLLETVGKVPGAIGYAEASAVGRYPNVKRVTLDERYPEFENVESDSYDFWTVEYFYTYGSPASDTLTAAFLEYLTSDTAKNILRSGGYTPCDDLEKTLKDRLCHR